VPQSPELLGLRGPNADTPPDPTTCSGFHSRAGVTLKIAAIDIGTNSIHMVIAQSAAQSGFEVVDREREVVQVGRGSFQGGRLSKTAIERTVSALARFTELARRQRVDRILCTATAAVREARNGGDFLRAARKAAGLTPRVIPAEEEGRLIYLAIRTALQLDEKPVLIVDIGGGSVQLVVGNREKLALTQSVPLGALRLTECMLESDPPSRRELQRLRRHIRKHSKEALEAVAELEPVTVYGSSGSIHALASAAHWADTGQPLEQLNGHVLEIGSLKRLTRRLQAMTLEEREGLAGLDARRAEIILPGALVLLHVLEALDADGITLSDYGVREGLVTDYLSFHAREISTLEQVEDVRMRSVLQLLQKFHTDLKHPRHIAELSLSLFDGLRVSHGLGDESRALLNAAALLHDVGAVIGHDGHAEHSFYVIRNGNLLGFQPEEVQVVASVARYHGKRRPRKRDDTFRTLDKARRNEVRWLSAILRVVEGLDRSHYQLIRALRVQRRPNRTSILLTGRRGAQLELWAARERIESLERMLGHRVVIEMDPAAEAAHPASRKLSAAKAARTTAKSPAILPLRSRSGR
jgi:exopolyphosphatase/guanosine-5'-triphosphate,3'-diphosphate pyrophosphatase